MHRASFSILCDDQAQASAIHQAVSVEAEDGPDGTSADLQLDGSMLTVAISAGNLSGLRAAMHGVLRLMDTARRVASKSGNV